MSGDGAFEFVEGVTSDLAFVARGTTPEAVFRAAVAALLAATVERSETVEDRIQRSLELSEPELDLLLRRLLNELIYVRDAEGLLLRLRALELKRDGEPSLHAELAGEALDPERHELACDVKAVTLHGLSVAPTADGWEATVTLDV